MGTVAALAKPDDVCGFLEAVTTTALMGWAWAPSVPKSRVTVQAWLGGQAVAEAPADRHREDLSSNGIGDGCYAFSLELPETLRGRGAELAVTARLGDGTPVALAAPRAAATADAVAERMDRLQRSVDAVMGAQRVLHRTLQAAVLQPRAEADGAAGSLAALEVAAARLDERLALLAPAAPAAGARGRTPWPAWAAVAIATLALAVSVAGVVHSVPWPPGGAAQTHAAAP